MQGDWLTLLKDNKTARKPRDSAAKEREEEEDDSDPAQHQRLHTTLFNDEELERWAECEAPVFLQMGASPEEYRLSARAWLSALGRVARSVASDPPKVRRSTLQQWAYDTWDVDLAIEPDDPTAMETAVERYCGYLEPTAASNEEDGLAAALTEEP